MPMFAQQRSTFMTDRKSNQVHTRLLSMPRGHRKALYAESMLWFNKWLFFSVFSLIEGLASGTVDKRLTEYSRQEAHWFRSCLCGRMQGHFHSACLKMLL